MRNAVLVLSSFMLAGTVLAQQTPATSSTSAPTPAAKPAAAATAPGVSKAPDAVPPPANPLTDAQAKQMLEMTGATSLKEQLSQGMMSYVHSSMPFMPQDVSDDIQQSFKNLDLETPIIAIYKQHISADDAGAIIAFYKTPAGKNMIQAMPTILQQTQQTSVQLARKTAQDAIQRHRPEIEAAAKQYQAEHAPKPAPSLNTPTPNASPASTPGTAPATAPGATPAAKPAAAPPSATTPQPK
jgi:uncharacterized protein